MTDFESFTKSYEDYRQAVARANGDNKAAVFEALAAASITIVSVTFDGEGGSGQIETVAAFAGDARSSLPGTAIRLQVPQWGRDQGTVRDGSLLEAIETLCYGYLEQEHGGWENNAGAYGEFTFDVDERTIALSFNGRYTDVYTHSHTF